MTERISITPRRKTPRKKFYICDRTRCTNCSVDCGHTTDIKYALYPDHDEWVMDRDGAMWQQVRRIR